MHMERALVEVRLIAMLSQHMPKPSRPVLPMQCVALS